MLVSSACHAKHYRRSAWKLYEKRQRKCSLDTAAFESGFEVSMEIY